MQFIGATTPPRSVQYMLALKRRFPISSVISWAARALVACAALSAALSPAPARAGIIVDNTDGSPTFSTSGMWASANTTSGGMFYGPDFLLHRGSQGAASATWRPNLPDTGLYEVFVRHTSGATRTRSAVFTVNYDGGSFNTSVDQTANGGVWNLIGTFPFATGNSGNVRLVAGTTATLWTVADAVQFSRVPEPAQANAFALTGPMTTARIIHTATLLPGGNVLVTGGYNNGGTILASAELYDPTTGTFSATGSMTTARSWHTATRLPNGKVLVASGYDSSGAALASAELYDPTTGTFSPTTGPMTTARGRHTSTLLPNGKVLVAGGDNSSYTLASAELYDPTTGTFSATGPMTTARGWHAATLLPNSKVLVAGDGASAELYDPATGTFTATGSMITTRYVHTSTLLPNGNVLVAGGYNNGGTILASAELYDPATGTFTATGSMTTGRLTHTATLLPNDKVLVAGGVNFDFDVEVTTYLASAELYDPTTGTFTATGSMSTWRYIPTATLLLNGTVLVAGGDNYWGAGLVSSAELYDSVGPNINSAITTIAALASSQLDAPGHKNALQNLLSQALSHLSSGNVSQAKNKLLAAINRTDGCVLRGTPDTNGGGKDWITDCAVQATIYAELTAAYNSL